MAWTGGDAQRREGNGDDLQEAHPTPLPGCTARPLLSLVTRMWKHPALSASQARDPKEINQNDSLPAKDHWDSGTCSSQSPGGRSAGGAVLWDGCVGGEQTRLYSRRSSPRRGMKSPAPESNQAFLGRGIGVVPGWGDTGRATPKTHPNIYEVITRRGSAPPAPCRPRLGVFWEGGSESGGQGRGREEEGDKGQSCGEEERGENAALFPPRARSLPEKASRCHRAPSSPSPRAGTRHRALRFWQQRGEIEAGVFTPRTEFGDPRAFHHGSVGSVSFPRKSLWRWPPNPTRWHLRALPGVPGARGGQSLAMLGWGAPAGSAAPQNIPSSNSLLVQADFYSKFWFTPGTEQNFQPGAWIPPV